MNENQAKPDNLADTTDCLEAVNVFKGWKNAFFIIVILCLLLLQIAFWVENTRPIKTGEETKSESPAAAAEKVTGEPVLRSATTKGEPNQTVEAASQQPEQKQKTPLFEITFKRLAGLIRFVNFVLILMAVLYCLTMLFSLKVSMLGRLGGINHIAGAFFFSLAFVVLLLPWQRLFDGIVFGAMYTPDELLSRCAAAKDSHIFGTTLHYLRFTGYWLLVLLLLLFSQLRSGRWSKAILRRLEVI